MNFQTNSQVLNAGSVGYTQVSPMKNIQFVNQRKKFFANNQHQKQSEYIYGSNLQKRGGYGQESVQEVEGIDTVKKQENHPIERFWNEYNRQRDNKRPDPTAVQEPQAAAPTSGLDNANFAGRFNSQLAKQQMLMGNFSPSQMWAHSQPHGQPKMSKRPSSVTKPRGIAATYSQSMESLQKTEPLQLRSENDQQNLPQQQAPPQMQEGVHSSVPPIMSMPPPDPTGTRRGGEAQSVTAAAAADADAERFPDLADLPFDQRGEDGQQLCAPYGVLNTPKTQQMYTMAENPKFQSMDPAQITQPYFPSDKTTAQISLEQARYLQRMNQAALRQQETLTRNMTRDQTTEKEKYAQSIENQTNGTGAIYTGGGESQLEAKKSMPLGKYISQLEMKDPEARRRLKEMLELQMHQKKQVKQERQVGRQSLSRPPVPLTSSNTALPGMLPPLHINRASAVQGFSSQSLTPHRANQGYVAQSSTNVQLFPSRLCSQSPLRGSGQNQILNAAAGLQGQRFNDIMNRGPSDKEPQPIMANALSVAPTAMRNYKSQPQLQPMQQNPHF